MPVADALQATLVVADLLERMRVPYLGGGSLASSLHGIPRATQDADVVADLRPGHVDALVAALSEGWYVDRDMILDAVRRRACFNVIHLATMFKVDVFVLSGDPAQQREMRRRIRVTIGDDPGREIFVASPEDIVLMKLDWYRLGGGVSDRQWGDVLGVLEVQGPSLDMAYLRESASDMGLGDLLERAFREAGQGQ